MAWAFVQGHNITGRPHTTSKTNGFASNVTAGNLIVACIIANTEAGTVPTVTVADSLSNTYSSVTAAISDTSQTAIQMFYAENISGGACTVTFTLGTASSAISWVSEYSGLATTSALDGHNSATGSSTSPSSGSVAVGASGELFVGLFAADSDGQVVSTITAPAGFTDRDNLLGVDNFIDVADKSVSTATTATWTLDASNTWGAVGASFKLAGGGTASGAGTADGLATASGVGASNCSGVGSADGLATASAVGASNCSGVGSAAGIATASGTGESTFAAVGSAAGVATASAVGASNFSGVGTADGIATASGVGSSTGGGSVGTADGTSMATASGGGGSVPDIGGIWLASPRSLRWLVRR